MKSEEPSESSNDGDLESISLQNKVRKLLLLLIILSTISVITGLYSIALALGDNPNLIWAFGGLIPLAVFMALVIFRYFKVNGYDDELKKYFLQLLDLKRHLEMNFRQTQISFEKEKREQIRAIENTKKNLNDEIEKNTLSLKRSQFFYQILAFFGEFKIEINPTELSNQIKQISASFSPFELFVTLEKNLKFDKSILQILYQYNSRVPIDEDLWSTIKENSLLSFLEVLEHTGKLDGHSKNLPTDVLVFLLKNLKIFSIDAINKQIVFINRFSAEIQDFYNFAQDENISVIKYILWKDILDWQQKFIENPPTFEIQFWDLCKNAIKLDPKWELKENLADVFVFYFFRDKYPLLNKQFCKIIAQSTNSSRILFFFLKNKRIKPLGDFFIENDAQIRRDIEIKVVDPLFEAFVAELQNGRFISEENHLFKIYRDERSFNLSYLTHLILNPDMPIDFEYAQDHYFSIKTSIPGLLRNLSLGTRHPFLLTFTSEGGIAEAFKEIMKPTVLTEFTDKYDIHMYSDNARLGILNETLDTLERFESELKKDLPKTYPLMKNSIKKRREYFDDFINYCQHDDILKKDSSKLKTSLENYFQLALTRQDFVKELESFKKRAENSSEIEDKELLEAKWQNLLESVKGYPPTFQIVIHELENDEKKIRVFGEYEKNNPFDVLKELCEKDTKDKALLLASIEFEEKRKLTHSVKDINESLINSFTLYAISSKEIGEIRNRPEYETFLDEKSIQFIISRIYPECKDLLEFCLKMCEDLLPSTRDLLLQQLKEILPDILKKNLVKVTQIRNSIIAYRELDEFRNLKLDMTPDLANKIASSMVNSCLCIGTVIYPKIKEAIEFLDQSEVKRIKQEFLEKLELDELKEKKAILLFYSLLSLYKDNLLRPLFKTGDVVDEPHFHDKVFSFLRMPFGDDIQDESDVAHGILDIYAFKTPVELKVEDSLQEISEIYNAHKAQFNAYCYRKQSKLGILYIYDNTEKIDENYPKHDLQLFQSDGYDCAVIILRGNLPKASTSGLEKTALTEEKKVPMKERKRKK